MAKPFPVAAVVFPRHIQGIGALPDFLGKMGHFRISPGIVSDGTKSIGGQGDSQRGKHPHGCKADAIYAHAEIVKSAGKTKSGNDASHNGQHRNPGGKHPHSHPVNDGGGRTLQSLFGYTPGRLVFVGSEVFC